MSFSVWIYYDKVTRLPKGDATLTYEDPDSTAAAIKYFDNQKFLDQVWILFSFVINDYIYMVNLLTY